MVLVLVLAVVVVALRVTWIRIVGVAVVAVVAVAIVVVALLLARRNTSTELLKTLSSSRKIVIAIVKLIPAGLMIALILALIFASRGQSFAIKDTIFTSSILCSYQSLSLTLSLTL